LQEAAAVLDTLAAGRVPDRAAVLAAALALSTHCSRTDPSRDMLDAAAGLETLATGGTLDLDATGRQRAAKLAQIVRQADQEAQREAAQLGEGVKSMIAENRAARAKGGKP
jgi:hypothetical protein